MLRLIFLSCIVLLMVRCRPDKGGSDDLPLRIHSFNPGHGRPGDQVRITGQSFSPEAAGNLVAFNGSVATVISASAGLLEVIVPADATSGKISVATTGVITESANSFTIDPPATGLPPVIVSIFPDHAAEGETVIITGENFSTEKAGNEIRFGGGLVSASDFIEAGFTMLKVKVPPTAENGPISINVGGREVLSPLPFTIDFSLLDFTPKQGLSGTVVNITGKRFPRDVEVFFGAQKINTISRLPGSLLAVIGGPESGRLTVRSGNLSKETDDLFHTRNIWIQLSEPTWGLDGITEKGVSFVYGGKIWNGFGRSTRFMMYDVEQSAWSSGTPHPAALAARESPVAYYSEGKLYVGQGSDGNGVNDWWRFDPVTSGWKQLTSPPSTAPAGVGFAIAGEGFLGLGPAQHLYAFDGIDPGTWSLAHQSAAAGPLLQSSFVIGNNAYFGGGILSPGSFSRLFYKYDGSSRTISRISPIPDNTVTGNSGRAASFVSNGKGYVVAAGTSLFEYDPRDDQWFYRTTAPGLIFTEVINGKVYGWKPDGAMYQYIP